MRAHQSSFPSPVGLNGETRSGEVEFPGAVCFWTNDANDDHIASWVERDRTFMGIAIHNLSGSGEGETEQSDLVAALKGTAAGILGTTAQMADLVCGIPLLLVFV